VDPDRLRGRLAIRHGHFFPRQLLDSQLETVEIPAPEEERVMVITEEDGPAQTVAQIVSLLPEAP
jgi:gluconate kinase